MPRPSAPPALAARLGRHAVVPTVRWVLDIPFEWRAWASASGVSWDAQAQVAVWTGPSLPVELQPFAAAPFSWEWRQQQALNPGLAPPPLPVVPPWRARPHQCVAASAIEASWKLGRVGFLLADEVGVGKTLSAWEFALRCKPLKKVLVVTTAPAIPHWRNSVLHAGHDGKQVLIVNYERLGKLFKVPAAKAKTLSTRAKGRRKRVANHGQAEAFDLVIFDEAHKGKNLTSARSLMMRKLGDQAKFVIWASATAGQNPLELAYLAKLLAQVTGHRLSEMNKDFEAWCKAQDIGVSRGDFGRWQWRKSQKALAKVNGWLFKGACPAGIRRLPQDIEGWKALERQIEPQPLPPQARPDYLLSWRDFQRTAMASRQARTGSARSKADKASGLVAQLRFRQKSSWLRIPVTLEDIADQLDNGLRVAVSVAFLDTLEEMARLLRESGIEPAVVHGRMNPAEKERQRLRFQKGQTPVVLFTVEEAISLHQGEHEDVPRILLIHDLRWSALQMAQIEGRCHRDGKFAPVRWVFADGTVEETIAQVLLDRVIAMKTMHGDDVSDLEAIENALAKHWKMAA